MHQSRFTRGIPRNTIWTVAAVLPLLGLSSSSAEELRVLSWNVESGGNNPEKIAARIRSLNADEYHIIALCEVYPRNYRRYAEAAGRRYRYVGSVTGGDDRLMILFDGSRLALNSYSELFNQRADALNDSQWRHRSPVVARLYDRDTRIEFMFLLNHLARGNKRLRQSQARGLRQWANEQDLPIIAAGDYNFDYDIRTEKGNRAFDLFREGGTWKWVVPENKIDTNWSDENGDRADDYPQSILDFVFVAGAAQQWSSKCEIVVKRGEFPDNDDTSDHRPLSTTLQLRK